MAACVRLPHQLPLRLLLRSEWLDRLLLLSPSWRQFRLPPPLACPRLLLEDFVSVALHPGGTHLLLRPPAAHRCRLLRDALAPARRPSALSVPRARPPPPPVKSQALLSVCLER